MTDAAAVPDSAETAQREVVFDVEDLSVSYRAFPALREVGLEVFRNDVTALIGPSGCGKTTFLRCLNRMSDLVRGLRVEGAIRYRGVDIHDPAVRPRELRQRIGMVFQKPNPFPTSIYDNIAFAPRANGARRSELDGIVESALRAAALWDEVKGKLRQSAFALSGGQQQRLCIARALAVNPDVLLLDEPCAALDPIATGRIEELLDTLRRTHTLVIVTHNLAQAKRLSDRTAFFTTDGTGGGTLVEVDQTERVFTNPVDRRTEDYVAGRVG